MAAKKPEAGVAVSYGMGGQVTAILIGKEAS